MSNWKIIVPESTVNYVLNPSAEGSGNFAAHNGATVTQTTAQARFGDYSYTVVTGAINRGINLTLSALANAVHAVSFYFRGNLTGTLQVSLDSGANYNAAAVVGGMTGGWVRYYASVPAAQANGSTAVIIRDTASETFRIDAVQVEAKDGYCTTYIDGDQTGGTWLGLRHGSYSWRDGQTRGGGRERDLDADYGVRVLQMPGAGYPPVQQHMQPSALNPGSLNLGYKVGARQLVLQLDLHSPTLTGLHTRRQDLIDLLRPDAYRGAQPVRLGYAGTAGTTLWADFYYQAGLELLTVKGGGNWIEGGGNVPATLIGADPYWYADDQVTEALSNISSSNAKPAARFRLPGDYLQWGTTGLSGATDIRAFAYDSNSGRMYIGGTFAASLNNICYWDGSALQAMGSGTVGVDATVYAIAIAPDGDVWVGGSFANCNGAASHGLAKWTPSTDTWTKYALGAGSIFYALAFDPDGNLYAGGNFTNWNGSANSDYIVKYDGTTWSALGTGMNGNVRAIAVYSSSVVYVGGEFTTGNSVTLNRVGYWNGTTFMALGTGAGSTVYALAVRSDGVLYAGGDFTTVNSQSINYVAQWSSGSWAQLGGGLTGKAPAPAVYSLALGANEASLLVGFKVSALQTMDGASVASPGFDVSLLSLLRFNFYAWTIADIVASSSETYAIFEKSNGETWTSVGLYWPVATSVQVTCAPVLPRFTFSTTNANGARLLFVENQTTQQQQFLNYLQSNGTTARLDEADRQMRFAVDGRGAIAGQPLAASDSLQLITGANYLAWFYDDAIQRKGTAILHYIPRYWSVDGPA